VAVATLVQAIALSVLIRTHPYAYTKRERPPAPRGNAIHSGPITVFVARAVRSAV